MSKENGRVGITGCESQLVLEQSASVSIVSLIIMNIIIPHNVVKHIESDDMWTEELVFVCKKTWR